VLVATDPVIFDGDFERTVVSGVMNDLRGLQQFLDDSNWRHS
jgi:hypothetical protein